MVLGVVGQDRGYSEYLHVKPGFGQHAVHHPGCWALVGLGLGRMVYDGMANPYGPQGRAPVWFFWWWGAYGCVVWVRVWAWGHIPPWAWVEWGGNTPGPSHMLPEGRLGPLDLSPEAAGWVSPDVAASHRASSLVVVALWAGRFWVPAL